MTTTTPSPSSPKNTSSIRLGEGEQGGAEMGEATIQGSQVPHDILALLPDAVCVVSEEGRFLFVNPAFEAILGYAQEDVVGKKVLDFLHPDDVASTMKQIEMIMNGRRQKHFYNRYVHKDGHLVDMQWSAQWHPQFGVRVAVGREISELRDIERQLEYQATHDPLTHLPNKRHVLAVLQQSLEHATVSGLGVAVFYIDMDGFKTINDRDGHEAGDALLCDIAKRLKKAIRNIDTPGRVGGDEFVVVAPGCATHQQARHLAKHLRECLRHPQHAHLDASVGVAVFPMDGASAVELLNCADKDMYAIKKNRQG